MTTRRLLGLLLIAALALAHWGRAAMCNCQHTAKQLPHVHLAELTFGFLGNPDAGHTHSCGHCHNHDHGHDHADGQDSPSSTELPDEEDVIYLPSSLDHDWRSESATDPIPPAILSADVWTASPGWSPREGPPKAVGRPPTRSPADLLTNTLLI